MYERVLLTDKWVIEFDNEDCSYQCSKRQGGNMVHVYGDRASDITMIMSMLIRRVSKKHYYESIDAVINAYYMRCKQVVSKL
jgi:hypothetical protein